MIQAPIVLCVICDARVYSCKSPRDDLSDQSSVPGIVTRERAP